MGSVDIKLHTLNVECRVLQGRQHGVCFGAGDFVKLCYYGHDLGMGMCSVQRYHANQIVICQACTSKWHDNVIHRILQSKHVYNLKNTLTQVRHDHTVTWLAYWRDTISQKDFKYVFLGATSSFKAESDMAKYEKARKLKYIIHEVRGCCKEVAANK